MACALWCRKGEGLRVGDSAEQTQEYSRVVNVNRTPAALRLPSCAKASKRDDGDGYKDGAIMSASSIRCRLTRVLS